MSEAMNRIIDEPTHASMLEANLPSNLWAEGQGYTVQLHNICKFAKDKNGNPISRYELFTGKKPKISEDEMYALGCLIYGYIPKPNRKGNLPTRRKCYVRGSVFRQKSGS